MTTVAPFPLAEPEGVARRVVDRRQWHHAAVRYQFGDVVLDTDRYELRRAGEPVHVEPQVFDVLAHLLANRDRVVPKTELLDTVWGDRFVGESALSSRIKAARQAVGDDGSAQKVIRTRHGRGYRFVADVRVADGEPRSRAGYGTPPLEQVIRFCTTSDGVRLAYATVGHGPPLVRAAHWITHLDYDWHSPVWRHWLEGLADGRTLVRYDERGCGLSDHDIGTWSIDAFVHDLETVVDDLGLGRFPLLGVSQGGPVAIAYADRHPERVSRLVLIGSYAQGRRRRARTEEERREADLQVEIARVGWGRDDPTFRRFFTSSFIPDASPELWDAFAELLRRTTPAENAAQLLATWAEIDVTEAARRIEVPTLILHARDELRVPFEQARQLAALIPGCRLVPLDSRNHLLRPDEPAWGRFLEEVDAFLAEDEG
jgi:pimeloyl-ACP methyl ester carboxylesterase/DNA-binding winged helix-turn-helix (wHTH) protein